MNKSAINASCEIIIRLLDDYKRLFAIAEKLEKQGDFEAANFFVNKIMILKTNTELLVDYLNKKSLSPGIKYEI